MADVFLAYAKEDEPIVESLCEKLENGGISVWYAQRDIKPGDFISGSITDAIKQCRVCVFIFSRSSIYASSFVKELQYVIQLISDEHRGIVIFPLVVDAEGKSVLQESTARNMVWFDASEPPLETRLQEAVTKLRRILFRMVFEKSARALP